MRQPHPNNHARTYFLCFSVFEINHLFHLRLVFFLARNRLHWTTFIIERIRTRTAFWAVVLTGALVFAQNQAVVAVSLARHLSATRHMTFCVKSFAERFTFLILYLRKIIAAQVWLRNWWFVRRCSPRCRRCRLRRGSSR